MSKVEFMFKVQTSKMFNLKHNDFPGYQVSTRDRQTQHPGVTMLVPVPGLMALPSSQSLPNSRISKKVKHHVH